MNPRRVLLLRFPLPLIVAFASLTSAPAFAQGVDTSLWVTNGPVSAVARNGGTIYIGGAFTSVGPATGAGAPVDTTSGLPVSGFPKVTGVVYSVAQDGSGGWYIGGDFAAVGGIPRRNIAHILSDMSVSGWNPSANEFSLVFALAVSGTTVYAGGSFNSIGGQTRRQIAALDAASGLATAWNPNVSGVGSVNALAVSGSTVYAGGSFSGIGGQTRNNIAALDSASGLATAWDPSANSQVLAITVSGSTVYASGNFTAIGGQTRNRIAALDSASGLATAWDPNANNQVLAIAVSGSTVYVCGAFLSIGGQSRSRIAALDAASGLATAWNPNANGAVWALAAGGSTVYAGGQFTSIGGQTRNNLAALDAASGLATVWNPNANNTVQALAASGSTVYAGGVFTSFGGQTRNNLAALDAASGLATAWNPNANQSVLALAVRGTTIYAGGSFGSVGGQLRSRLAALDATSGLATAWNPSADFNVNALVVSGTKIYAGGDFTTIGGQARNRIAALDATSGLATAWNPNADNLVYALALSGATIYAGGQFASIGEQTRNRIAALDTASGLATAWNPNANSYVIALTASGATVYAGGNFSTIGGQARSRIAALDTTSGLATAWNPNANSNVRVVVVSGSTVYAGGDFTSVGGQTRLRIASLDATSGLATAWDPNAGLNTNGGVRAIAVSGTMVHAGGSFVGVGGLPQANLAAIAVAPTVISILPSSGGVAGAVTATVLGGGLSSDASIRLSRGGQPDIVGTSVVAAADGSSLTATFDLTGAALGLWDLMVTNPDLQMATLPSGFTIEQAAPHQVRVDVLGPALMRPNRRKAFDIVMVNQGNSDVLSLPLWVTRIPNGATVELDFPLAHPPRSGGEPDWSLEPPTLTGPGGRYLPLVIPRIPPGTTVRRIYLTVPETVTSFVLEAALAPPWADREVFRGCLNGAGVITAPACMGAQLTAINAYLTATSGIQAMSGVGLWAKVAWQCEGAASLPAALAQAEAVLDLMLQPIEHAGEPVGCGGVLVPRWQDSLSVTLVTSVDPNDKLGSGGNGLTRQIGVDHVLEYSIRFENEDIATGPVQSMVVTDVLDANKLDLTTLSLGRVQFGKRANGFSYSWDPSPGSSDQAAEVDLWPEQDLYVQVSVHLDPATHILSWTLTGYDSTSRQPISEIDPQRGFLPANDATARGEGSVLFTVRPKPGLSGGTAIRNTATIIFDEGTPRLTPEWLNTLDATPPESQVQGLAVNQDLASFTVSWGAVGPQPDLHDFSVYVSQDGGEYLAWRVHVTATSDTIIRPGGHAYTFYSLGRDSSDNIEGVPAMPDAGTYSRAAADEVSIWRLALEGVRPNPATGPARVWFALPSRERATFEVFDVAGRRMMRREVGAMGPGRHSVDVSPAVSRPGLYFLRLGQAGHLLQTRMVVIR